MSGQRGPLYPQKKLKDTSVTKIFKMVALGAYVDLKLIETAMAKCSTYFRGHDSANAVGDAYPTIDEIEQDIKTISEFNFELTQTRKRN